MNVRRVYEQSVAGFLDSHDPVERVFALLVRFFMASQLQDFVRSPLDELTFQGQYPGRIIVRDARTGRAAQAMGRRRRLGALSSSFMKNQSELRADRRVQGQGGFML